MKPCLAAALVCTGLAAAVPATAHADFGPPQPLSPTYYASGADIDLGIEDDGDAAAVYSDFGGGGVWWRRRTAAGTLGSIVTLSGDGTGESDVAVDPVTGRALAVWIKRDPATRSLVVRGRFRNADGTFGNAFSVSSTAQTIYGLRAAMNRSGQAAVAWLRHDGAVYRAQVRTIAADGTMAAVGTVSPAGADASSLDLAIDPSGNADAVWTRLSGDFVITELAERRTNGTTAYTRTMSAPQDGTSAPRVATDPAGGAIVVWGANADGDQAVRLRRLRPDGTLGTEQRVSGVGDEASEPDVAVDPKGDAMVAWEALTADGEVVQLRSRRADGVMGFIQTADAGTDAAVAVDRLGNPVLAWHRPGGGVAASVHGAAGPAQTVSAAAGGPSAEEKPALVENRSGYALLGWNLPQQGQFGSGKPMVSAAPPPAP
ncbi:MAG TPA: hypothetical protein VF533_07210 [Solirubrobacteraceae bacterium]|jgi:hypothetical protein